MTSYEDLSHPVVFICLVNHFSRLYGSDMNKYLSMYSKLWFQKDFWPLIYIIIIIIIKHVLMLNMFFNMRTFWKHTVVLNRSMRWDVKVVMGLNNMVACDSKKNNLSVILKGVYLKNILSFSEL